MRSEYSSSGLRRALALFRSRKKQSIVELALRKQLAIYAQQRHF